MLLKIDHCPICANSGSIFAALFMINSLYGFVSPLVSSILFNCLSCSNSFCNVSVLIISHDSVFMYTKLACSCLKYCPLLGWSLFISPPTLGLRGKNVVKPFLPLRSLNDLLSDFVLNLLYCNHLVHLTLGVLMKFVHLPN